MNSHKKHKKGIDLSFTASIVWLMIYNLWRITVCWDYDTQALLTINLFGPEPTLLTAAQNIMTYFVILSISFSHLLEYPLTLRIYSEKNTQFPD